MQIARFDDEYEAIAPLLGLSVAALKDRDRDRNQPVRRWMALRDDAAIGVVTAFERPDARLFFSHAGEPASLGRLLRAAAESLQRQVYATVDDSDTARLKALSDVRAEIEMTAEQFRVPFQPALAAVNRAWTPTGYQIVAATEVDETSLFELDNIVRGDVPGTDGWVGNREWFDAELVSDEFDPATYRVGIHTPTGELAGLVRMWRNDDGPRLGLVGVRRCHRGTVLAAALLKEALTASSTWGWDWFKTGPSTSNPVTYPMMAKLGAVFQGRTHQVVVR